MRLSGARGDFLITQSSGIVKSCCGDENLGAPGDFSHHSKILNCKIPRAPKDFLITQPPRIVKSHLVDVKISPYEKRALIGALFGLSDI